MRALTALAGLVRSGQKGAQDRALAEARRVANGRDARFALALFELEIGRRRGDEAMRAKALDALITSPLTARDKLPGHLASRGQIAYRAGDLDTAGRLWGRWVELVPSDADALANLAQVRSAQGDHKGALDLLTRATAAREGLGQAASELWLRQRLSIAQQGNLAALGIAAARALVQAYPTPENWRVALVVYRQLAASDEAFEIDVLRLMRHVGALVQAAEYQRMAQLLKQAGAPGEAKAVLQEGLAGGLLDPATSPTREIIAEVDRAVAKVRGGSAGAAAGSKAGAQVRLGVAKLLGGQRAEAEAAFRAAAGMRQAEGMRIWGFFWLASLGQGDAAVGGVS
jgi:tetratricopeptide (TPR) repeat protein